MPAKKKPDDGFDWRMRKIMQQKSISALAIIIFALAFQTAAAQITLKFPKLPKTNKPEQAETKPGDDRRNQTAPGATNQPTKPGSGNIYKNQRPTNVPVFLKNTLYVQALAHQEYWKLPNERDYSSWIPMIRFSQFYDNEKPLNYTVEYFNSDGSAWFSENLEQGIKAADRTISFKSSNPYERLKTKSTVGTGIYSFKITDRDTKEVLYQGKFEVGKFSTATRSQEKNKFDFFVEHDWLLPFGMVGFDHGDLEIGGIPVEVSVWLKGMVKADELEGRVFYKGQQINLAQDEINKNVAVDYDERTTEFAAPFAPQNTWKRWLFRWHNFRFDNNGSFQRNTYPNAFYADKNPGEYTVKIYRNGIQIRELGFSIGADGKFIVPDYSNQIPLPYYRIILPVKVLGPEKWDAASWKTEAFYGNPLSVFNVR